MSNTTNIIAASEWWTYGWPVFALVVQLGHAALTAVLAARAREVHRLRETLERVMEDKIDNRFARVDEKLADHDKRLTGGHGHFDRLDRSIHDLAIADRDLKEAVIDRINQLGNDMNRRLEGINQQMVTLDDLKRWKELNRD